MAQQRQNPFGLQHPPAPGVDNTAREALEPLNLSLYTMSTMQTSKKKKIKKLLSKLCQNELFGAHDQWSDQIKIDFKNVFKCNPTTYHVTL